MKSIKLKLVMWLMAISLGLFGQVEFVEDTINIYIWAIDDEEKKLDIRRITGKT